MKLANISVSSRLKDNPASIFKVNQLTVSEDEKSIILSSLNDVSSKQAHFDHCFDQASSYSDVIKRTEFGKNLKQLIHGYNAAMLAFGVGEAEAVGSRAAYLLEHLDALERLLDQNAYRYHYDLSYRMFGISDSHCIDMLTYQKVSSSDIDMLLADWDAMEPINDLNVVRSFVKKGYTLPLLVFIRLRVEARNELEDGAATVSVLALGDLGSLNGPTLERSVSHLRSIVLTLDQTFVSGEIRVRETQLTHLLSPFVGGNAHTSVFLEFMTNASFSAAEEGFMFGESLRKVKNRIEQNFENFLVGEVNNLSEENNRLDAEKHAIEERLEQLNVELARLSVDRDALRSEQLLLSAGNESQRFLLEYNAARVEVEQLELKERIRALRIEMVNLDHQRALRNSMVFEESLHRRRAEYEARRAVKAMRDGERHYQSQIMSLRDRIGKAGEELQRSVEERSIMQSKLQHSQARIDQLNEQLREAEASRHRLERNMDDHKGFESRSREAEIVSLRRQLENARDSERMLSVNVAKVEGRSEQGRREVLELERELRGLRSENSLLQAKLKLGEVANTGTKASDAGLDLSRVSTRRGSGGVKRRELNGSSEPVQKTAAVSVVNSPSPIKSIAANMPSIPLLAAARRPSALAAVQAEENSVLANVSIASDPAKKKIRLPDRPRAMETVDPKATPQASNVDSQVMNSIISNFKVKLPLKK